MDAIRKEVRKALIDSMKIINDTRRQLVQAADKAALNLLNQLAEEVCLMFSIQVNIVFSKN